RDRSHADMGRPSAPAPAAIAPAAPAPAATEPSVPKGRATFVTVVSDPPGAMVQWNGRMMGATPATMELAPGSQSLSLSKEGFAASDILVDVPQSSDQPLLRTVTLKSLAKTGGHVAPPPRPSRPSSPVNNGPSEAPAANAAPAAEPHAPPAAAPQG